MIFHFKHIISSISLLLLLLSNSSTIASEKNIRVKGYGTNESTALSDAKKNAVSRVCGETIVGSTRVESQTERNTRMESSGDSSKSLNVNTKSSDDNLSLVGGSIKSDKILKKGTENGVFFVEIEAIVTNCTNAVTTQTALTNQAMLVQLQKLSAELKTLGGSNNIVKKPRTLAEKYHNARILSQRGEVDLALRAYEDVVKEKILFADPFQDMVTLSKRIYGVRGSKNYLEKTLSHLKNRPEYLYAMQLLDEKPLAGVWEAVKDSVDTFPPLGHIFLIRSYEHCYASSVAGDGNDCFKKIGKLQAVETIAQKLVDKIKSGENLNFYIDSNKALLDTDSFGNMFSKSAFTMYR